MGRELTDAELLGEIDDHEESCNHIEAEMLDSMLKQVGDEGRRLTPNQRRWAEDLLAQLNRRAGS